MTYAQAVEELMSNNADTTIKTEHQLEENLMGVLRTRNACRLPREHGQVKSLSAEKNETCFGMLVKKISTYAPVRTRTLWVEKQASYH